MAQRLNGENFKEIILQSSNLCLVDFYSDSCVPCKRMSPVLAEIEETFDEPLTVGKVNVAYESELVERYEVASAPTFLIFKNGEVADRFSGVVPKQDIEEKLRKVASES